MNNKYETIDFTIMVANACNFNCEYCVEEIPYIKDKHFVDFDKISYVLEQFFSAFPNTYLNIELYGGEPTLHPKLVEFCQKLNQFNRINEIEITTNFSASVDIYKKLLSCNKLKISATYHAHSMPYIDFLTKANKLSYERVNYIVVFEQHSFDICTQIFKDLIKLSDKVLIYPVASTDKYNSCYTQSQYNILKELISSNEENKQLNKYFKLDIVNNRLFQPKKTYFIDLNGDVYPCNSMLYNVRKNYPAKINNCFIDNISECFSSRCNLKICEKCNPPSVVSHNFVDFKNKNYNLFSIENVEV